MVGNLIGIFFCFGVFLTIREFLQAEKSGVPISRVEKWYLATAPAIAFGALMFAASLGWGPRAVPANIGGLFWGLFFSAWVVRRRLRHKPPHDLARV